MARRLTAVLFVLGCLAGGGLLSGCGSSGSGSSGTSGGSESSGAPAAPTQEAEQGAGASRASAPTVRVARAQSASGREPATSQTPSSGVCPRTRAPVVDFLILSDTPGPRCEQVGGGQRLRLINETGFPGQPPNPVKVDFAGFQATIKPHHAVVLDAPVGSYLDRGVHSVEVKGAPGPEVWVK